MNLWLGLQVFSENIARKQSELHAASVPWNPPKADGRGLRFMFEENTCKISLHKFVRIYK